MAHTTNAVSTGHCPDCGAAVFGGREGCQTLWDELRLATGHVAAFDAYCMQHLERYCLSAKSYAAHLTRLCCGVEHQGHPHVYAAIQHWLNGVPPIAKPPLLTFLGALTIADVHQAQPGEARERQTQAWVASVWEAYASQHALAREWVTQAMSRRTTGTAHKNKSL